MHEHAYSPLQRHWNGKTFFFCFCYTLRIFGFEIKIWMWNNRSRCVGSDGSIVKAGYSSESRGVEPQQCQAATFGPCTKTLNPLCFRGAVSWLILCSDPNSLQAGICKESNSTVLECISDKDFYSIVLNNSFGDRPPNFRYFIVF